MTALSLKLFSILIIFFISVISGIIPFYKKLTSPTIAGNFIIGESLACGVFLGAGLIHMLGDASHQFTVLGYHYPFAFLIAGIIFLFMLWLEHLGNALVSKSYETASFIAILATFMLAIHSFLEGSALGITDNLSLLIILFLAIIAHKWAAGFALAVQINKSQLRFLTRVLLFGIFAIMTPLGIYFGNSVNESISTFPTLEPIFVSLAAGTFIYLGTLHGLKQAVMVEHCCNLYHYSFVMLGFTLMAFVAIWT